MNTSQTPSGATTAQRTPRAISWSTPLTVGVVLLGLLAFGALIFFGVRVYYAYAQPVTALDSGAGALENTYNQEGESPNGDGGDLVVNAEPTEVAQVQPTATLNPTATPLPTNTPVPNTPTPLPTNTPVPTQEPLNNDQVYAIEMSKLAEDPLRREGQNVGGPVVQVVPANSYLLSFTGHGRFTIDGKFVSVVWTEPAENVVSLYNDSDKAIEVTITNFPDTGFVTWLYQPGEIPEAELLAAIAVLNPTHCGMSAGCPKAFVWNVTWNGTNLSSTKAVITEPYDYMVASQPLRTVAWDSLTVAQGLEALRANLSQPVTLLKITDVSTPLKLGVTAGKDHLISLPKDAIVEGPEGNSYVMESAGIVLLSYTGEDTAVYKIWLPYALTLNHWEFRLGFDSRLAAGALQSIPMEIPSTFSLLTVAGKAPTAPVIVVFFDFDGSSTTLEEVIPSDQ